MCGLEPSAVSESSPEVRQDILIKLLLAHLSCLINFTQVNDEEAGTVNEANPVSSSIEKLCH